MNCVHMHIFICKSECVYKEVDASILHVFTSIPFTVSVMLCLLCVFCGS